MKGELEVIQKVTRNNKKYLELKCSICSLDTELYPEPFLVREDAYEAAKTPPCGCGGNYRYSERQLKTLVSRVCKKKEYEVLSYDFSEKGKAYHKVRLSCNKGHDFNINITTLLSGGGCLECFRNSLGYDDFEENVNRVLKEKGYQLLKIGDHSRDNYMETYIYYTCQNNHNTKTKYHVLIRGSGCKYCGYENSRYGCNYSRMEDEDTLYLVKLYDRKGSEVFYKIGRTFDLKSRLRGIKSSSNQTYLVEVVDIIKMPHKDIITLEEYLHKILKEYHYIPNHLFGGSLNECYLSEENTIKSNFYNVTRNKERQ